MIAARRAAQKPAAAQTRRRDCWVVFLLSLCFVLLFGRLYFFLLFFFFSFLFTCDVVVYVPQSTVSEPTVRIRRRTRLTCSTFRTCNRTSRGVDDVGDPSSVKFFY